MSDNLPDLEAVYADEFDLEKSRYSILYQSKYKLEELTASLVMGAGNDGTIQDATERIFGTPCLITDWDVDKSRGMVGLHIAFPNHHPRYADGAQLHSYGLITELSVFKGVPMDGHPNAAGAIKEALAVDLGRFGGDPHMEIYHEEDDVAEIWFTVSNLVVRLPKLNEVETVLKQIETILKLKM